MSRAEILQRGPVRCNHNAVCHDAMLIDCFYQGYQTHATVSHWIFGTTGIFSSKLLMKSVLERLF
jgi:hypothetical protein